MANEQHDSQHGFRAISVHVQWEARKENVVSCAAQVSEFVHLLEELSPAFSVWAQKSQSRKAALQNSNLDLNDTEVVTGLLLRGRNRTDVKPRTVIEELGFSIGLWNKDAHEVSASLSIHCGCYSKYVGNSIILEFSPVLKKSVVTTQCQIGILRGMIEIWKPTTGAITRQAAGPHPLGLPNEPTELQLAYFSVPNHDDHPIWRPSGKVVELIGGGSLWIDESVLPYFET